jgi:hypothetical protein
MEMEDFATPKKIIQKKKKKPFVQFAPDFFFFNWKLKNKKLTNVKINFLIKKKIHWKESIVETN